MNSLELESFQMSGMWEVIRGKNMRTESAPTTTKRQSRGAMRRMEIRERIILVDLGLPERGRDELVCSGRTVLRADLIKQGRELGIYLISMSIYPCRSRPRYKFKHLTSTEPLNFISEMVAAETQPFQPAQCRIGAYHVYIYLLISSKQQPNYMIHIRRYAQSARFRRSVTH